MTLITRTSFFCLIAEKKAAEAKLIFDNELESSRNVYFNIKSHLKSALHPLAHLARIILDIQRLIYGTSLMLTALYIDNEQAINQLKGGLRLTALSLGYNNLTYAISLFSLVNRFLLTVFNKGYTARYTEKNTMINMKLLESEVYDDKNHELSLNVGAIEDLGFEMS